MEVRKFFFLSLYLVQWTFRLNCEFQSALLEFSTDFLLLI